MIHARKDYDRIQDPALHDPSLLSEGSTPFADDEPVFLLRAQDETAHEFVRLWAMRQQTMRRISAAVFEATCRHADLMLRWPKRKAPDVPDDQVR